MAGNTGTGWVLEQMVLPALGRGGYRSTQRVDIGERFGGGRHIVDVVAESLAGEMILVSLKWQQVSGTAEQKVPYEAMCLAEAVRTTPVYAKAYLVLGGEGWKLRRFFTSGGLSEHLRFGSLVSIVTLEAFVALANASRL